jgi:proline dehydrogenase
LGLQNHQNASTYDIDYILLQELCQANFLQLLGESENWFYAKITEKDRTLAVGWKPWNPLPFISTNHYSSGTTNMLRSILIYLSKAEWARKIVTSWSFAWRTASRFVAGETLQDAIRVVQGLNQKGITATLDHLGEHTNTPENARRATRDILEILECIHQSGVKSNVSIKLTQIGIKVDEALCRENLEQILKRAKELGIFVRIDMEDSPWVDKTLELYRQMRDGLGFDNVGVVIQSYLYRSGEDIRQLAQDGGYVRLCKGAYKEPDEIAYPRKADVDASFDRLARMLMDGSQAAGSPLARLDGRFPPLPALATHDERRVENARQYARQIGLPQKALEFQMLHGIRRDLQEELVAQGYPVRVYVPYGTEWYPYFTRRLAERPANLWFFVSNFFRR